MVFSGDFNLVGAWRPVRTIVQGDIVTESAWGPDFPPDLDGTALAVLDSRHVGAPLAYTWRRPESAFWPGLLDFMLFTDSALEVGTHFILDTGSMSEADLEANGLEAQDSEVSDHLLRCADFRRRD